MCCQAVSGSASTTRKHSSRRAIGAGHQVRTSFPKLRLSAFLPKGLPEAAQATWASLEAVTEATKRDRLSKIGNLISFAAIYHSNSQHADDSPNASKILQMSPFKGGFHRPMTRFPNEARLQDTEPRSAFCRPAGSPLATCCACLLRLGLLSRSALLDAAPRRPGQLTHPHWSTPSAKNRWGGAIDLLLDKPINDDRSPGGNN